MRDENKCQRHCRKRTHEGSNVVPALGRGLGNRDNIHIDSTRKYNYSLF